MNWTNLFAGTLAWWQWALLLAIPPAIVLLYFLKLKRQPLEVPSTYLWSRTVEDLHVNSIWQRLRRNLLLFLQLLMLLLAILALLRPSWQGNKLTDDRYIFLVDTSASMSATDISPSRLDEAKRQLVELIDHRLKPGSVAMVISFSDRAIVEQPFTDNRRLLKRRVQNIQPTNRISLLDEALRVAAGLANPGRSGTEATDIAAAEAQPASLIVFSDGRFHTTPNFAMGNLEPTYVPIGQPAPRNLGILAFSTRQEPERPDVVQVFGRLENFGADDAQVTVNLYLNDQLIDAAAVEVPAGGQGGVQFTLDQVDPGELKLQIQEPDDLAVDNTAYAALDPPRRTRLLVVTPGNDALVTALGTGFALTRADAQIVGPEILEKDKLLGKIETDAIELVIFDQCAPKTMPPCNTFFLGRAPPDESWGMEEKRDVPQIIDVDQAHPLMQFVEMGNVRWIAEATPLQVPPGGRVLIDSDEGPLLAIAPRESYEDLVQAFEIVGSDPQGQRYANTDWPIRTSFPVFLGNVLTYLGGAHADASPQSVQPGQTVPLRPSGPAEELIVVLPNGQQTTLGRAADNQFLFGDTITPGVYQVRKPRQEDVQQRFAVNLFDQIESDLQPNPNLQTTYEEISGRTGWETTRYETWKYLLLGAMVVLVFEWYIYNRRVYL